MVVAVATPAGMALVSIPHPLLHHVVVGMAFLVAVYEATQVWLMFRRDARAWFRVPPGRLW
jgi:hypothetical protein